MYNIKKRGKIIGTLRKNAGYTQEKFAEKIGISDRSVADIERGYRGTSIDTLLEMSESLKVSLDYLVLGKNEAESDGDKLLLEIVKGVPEEKKILAGKILRGILASLEE